MATVGGETGGRRKEAGRRVRGYGHNSEVSSLDVWQHSKGRGAFLVPDLGCVAGGKGRAGRAGHQGGGRGQWV